MHHHRYLPDGLSVAEVTERARKTWPAEPLFHISSPLAGWDGPKPERHHDYINAGDFPVEWLGWLLTVEVEAKAKELAVAGLIADLNGEEDPMSADKLILLTGATGYIGGRLLPRLVEDGWRVRCLAWSRNVCLRVCWRVSRSCPAMCSIRHRYPWPCRASKPRIIWFIRWAKGDFVEPDRLAADNFAAAASAAGVRRIIYLGGLGEEETELSAHLRSRQEVGERLRAHGVPVIELRASIIIGSGSLSFELICALVERLPVMVTPRWVRVMAQPIAINDVLDYLRAALTVPDQQWQPRY